MIKGISFTQIMKHLKCEGSMVLMKGKLHSKLYYLQASVIEGETIVASGKNDLNRPQLWHCDLVI